MRWWLSGFLVVLVACSKRCAKNDNPPPLEASAPVVSESLSTSRVDPAPARPVLAKPALLEMPDACLTVAQAIEWRRTLFCQDGRWDFEELDAGGRMHADSEEKEDLNGDGVPEIVAEIGYGDDREREIRLYVGGAPCATEIAQFEMSFTVLKTRHDGWADLQIVDGDSYCEGQFVCGCRASETFYIHTKDGYVSDPSRKIEGKTGHCPHVGDDCTKNSDCAPVLKCVAGHCAN